MSQPGTSTPANGPIVAVSMGDPAGIGPEVLVKALADNSLRERAAFIVYGDPRAMALVAGTLGIRPFWRTGAAPCRPGRGDVVVGPPSPGQTLVERWPPLAAEHSGEASFRWVELAIAAAQLPRDHPGAADAVVTGPISKEAWALAGHGRYSGHTELLAERCCTTRFAMMFHAPAVGRVSGAGPMSLDDIGLNVILATTHIPIAEVPRTLTTDRVRAAIELGHEAMVGLLGPGGPPRIAVCGLNPHAGEGGLIGSEDDTVIAPAIALARESAIEARGPFPADTIFRRALASPGVRPEFDLVVAMYHDQGLIPLKVLARDRAVNMTVGLPIIRTSPDHGTAFDIAGKGVAVEGSMRTALSLAIDLAERRVRSR